MVVPHQDGDVAQRGEHVGVRLVSHHRLGASEEVGELGAELEGPDPAHRVAADVGPRRVEAEAARDIRPGVEDVRRAVVLVALVRAARLGGDHDRARAALGELGHVAGAEVLVVHRRE